MGAGSRHSSAAKDVDPTKIRFVKCLEERGATKSRWYASSLTTAKASPWSRTSSGTKSSARRLRLRSSAAIRPLFRRERPAIFGSSRRNRGCVSSRAPLTGAMSYRPSPTSVTVPSAPISQAWDVAEPGRVAAVLDAVPISTSHTRVARKPNPSWSARCHSKFTDCPAVKYRQPSPGITVHDVQQPPGVSSESITPHPCSGSQFRTVPFMPNATFPTRQPS
ncbi:hypothetical protein NG2371_06567 [Nocardia gamkensis]|nr:hypothetical protein [Nocardia gamkensis]